MLSSETIKQLKQGNISKDADKTKERIETVWKAMDKEARKDMLELAGLAKITAERAYRQGKVSARLMAAISQASGTDPYYLSGETDEPENFTDELLEQYLTGLGYKISQNKNTKPKRKYNRKPKTEDISEEAAPAVGEADFEDNEAVPVMEEAVPVVLEAVPVVTETPAVVIVEPAEVKPQVTLQSMADAILSTMTVAEKETLRHVTDEDLAGLLRSFTLRANFSLENERLFTLIKYIMVR
jgi:hypothetical protein